MMRKANGPIPALVFKYSLRTLAVLVIGAGLLLPMGLTTERPPCDDLGSAPAPVNEEELRFTDALPLLVDRGADDAHLVQAEHPLHPDDEPLCGAHGEVPHPPPWA
jgi:hypothetical protein